MAWHVARTYRQEFDEALSDAFLGLAVAATSRDPARPFGPYAHKCVWGALMNLHPSSSHVASKRNCGLSLDHPSACFEDAQPSPQMRAEISELWRTVDELPDRERKAVRLYYGCGLLQDEIAPILDVSQMQVSRDLRNARATPGL